MSHCGPHWIHLDWCSLYSLDLEVCFLPQVRRSYYTFKFSPPFYLSFPAETFNVNVSMLGAFQRSLNLSSLLVDLLIAVHLGCFPLPCLPDCWSILLHPLFYCWFFVVYFSFHFISFQFISIQFQYNYCILQLRLVLCLYFLSTFFTFSLSSYTILSSLVNILIIIIWKSSSG